MAGSHSAASAHRWLSWESIAPSDGGQYPAMPAPSSGKIRPGSPPQGRVTYAEPMRGVLVEVEATDQTLLLVETKQGNFTCKPTELRPGRPQTVLDGRATIEALGTAAVT